MLKVQLQKPYKILSHKVKRYTNHYHIPAENCVIIPLKFYGEDASCNVRWEDENGVLHLKEGLFFQVQNLEPVNAMSHFKMYELWQHYNSVRSQTENVLAV